MSAGQRSTTAFRACMNAGFSRSPPVHQGAHSRGPGHLAAVCTLTEHATALTGARELWCRGPPALGQNPGLQGPVAELGSLRMDVRLVSGLQ